MNDIEEMNKQMDKELENSPALKMAFIQIRDLDNRVKKLEAKRVCGQCGAMVDRNEWHLIYASTEKEKESGVCEECWQTHYVPFMHSTSG